MKNLFLKDISDGQKLKAFACAVQSIKKSTTKDGKSYLDMVLFDKSGSIKAKVWESAISLCDEAVVGDVVLIDANVGEYQGSLQLVLSSMRKTNDFDETDFVEQAQYGVDSQFQKLSGVINELTDTNLKNLLRKIIIENESFSIEVKNAFGAEKAHHAFLGGLVEHINEMIEFARPIIRSYPLIDGDLLIAGIVLHDIGKVVELSRSIVSVSRTRRGHLLGHIIQGLDIVESAIREIDGFPSELADRLSHLIASHHGKLEFGSPVKPMTIEALALHYIDMLSSKLNMVKVLSTQIISKEGFSEYSYLLEGRFYFTPENLEIESVLDSSDSEVETQNLTIPF